MKSVTRITDKPLAEAQYFADRIWQERFDFRGRAITPADPSPSLTSVHIHAIPYDRLEFHHGTRPLTGKRSPSVREETHPIKICVVCKRPILPEQRPSVQVENGEEVHIDCWLEYDKRRREKQN